MSSRHVACGLPSRSTRVGSDQNAAVWTASHIVASADGEREGDPEVANASLISPASHRVRAQRTGLGALIGQRGVARDEQNLPRSSVRLT